MAGINGGLSKNYEFREFVDGGNYEKAFDMYFENPQLAQSLSREEVIEMLDYSKEVLEGVISNMLQGVGEAADRIHKNLEGKMGEIPTIEEMSRSVKEVEEH